MAIIKAEIVIKARSKSDDEQSSSDGSHVADSVREIYHHRPANGSASTVFDIRTRIDSSQSSKDGFSMEKGSVDVKLLTGAPSFNVPVSLPTATIEILPFDRNHCVPTKPQRCPDTRSYSNATPLSSTFPFFAVAHFPQMGVCSISYPEGAPHEHEKPFDGTSVWEHKIPVALDPIRSDLFSTKCLPFKIVSGVVSHNRYYHRLE